MALNATENYTPDRLLGGDSADLVTDQGTIVSGQTLTRGTVLGKIAASGKYTKCVSTASDGSQIPVAILAIDTDASGGDKIAPIYVGGEFNSNFIIFGGTDTAATTPLSAGSAAWAATTAKTVGQVVTPTVANGFAYRCIVAGTTGGSAPTWPQVDGGAVQDGTTLVWHAIPLLSHQDYLRLANIYLKSPVKA